MNLLIGLVVVVCLFVCEVDSQSAAEDVWTRIAAMLLVAFSVPGLAVFQTLALTKNARLAQLPTEQQEKTLQRLAICHSGVWLVASLMIVWAIKWQTVVRSNWQLNRWPLVDEALILLPIVLSLVASWAIFYDIQRSLMLQPKRPPALSLFASIFDPRRIAFATVRFRVYFVMSLLPLSVLVGLRDVSRLTESTPIVMGFCYLTTTSLILVGFPFILGLIWNVRPVANEQLANELSLFCRQYQLRVAGVRVWHTDHQIANAMVVGFVPWFRTIIITDGMLEEFPKQELFAILRHEAGHIRLCHLPIRVGFVLLPLLVLAVAEQMGVSAITKLNSGAVALGITGQPEWLAMSIVYVAYLIPALSWLSKKMEYEADLFAISSNPGSEGQSRTTNKNANALLDALLRFASHFPQQLDRKTLMHPSVRQRMKKIANVRDNPELFDDMKLAWGKQLVYVLMVLAGVCLAAIII